MEGGQLLTRVDQRFRYASDIDLKLLKTVLERLERGRGLLVSGAVSYDAVVELRTTFEDMLALLLGSQQGSQMPLPRQFGIAFDQVVGQLRSSSVPNASAIAALVQLALPFHSRLQTRVGMALKNAGELLSKANAGEFDMDGYRVTPPSLFALRYEGLDRARSAS